LTAVIPWGLTPAKYDLRVVNPDGSEGNLHSAVEVTQGIGQWRSQALDGGPVGIVMPVVKTQGLIYAYSDTTQALYKSTDSGANWATVGHMGGQFLSIDQINPNNLYLNEHRSSDGGATWQGMLTPESLPGESLNPGQYTQTFPDPAHSGTIYLAMADIPSGMGVSSGLLRSTDYGDHWAHVEQGLSTADKNVTAMAFSPDSDQIVYLGTRDGDLYESTNGGAAWTQIGSGPILTSIGILAINPYNHNEMWVTTQYAVSPTAQVIKIDLSDPANTSTQFAEWPEWLDGNYPKTLGFVDANTVYIGLLWDNGCITEDGGDSWTMLLAADGKPGNSLALDPWDANKLTFYFADEQYGVQKSTDGGVTWGKANLGLHAMAPDIMAIDPTHPARVYAKIAQNGWPGIFISEDGGQNWSFSSLMTEKSNYRPLTSTLAANAKRVFVGAHSHDDKVGPNLYYSEDQGSTWNLVMVDPTPNFPSDFYMPWALQVDPNQPDTLLLTAVIGDRSMTTDQFFSEIYRSTDNGDTWQRVNLMTQMGHDVYNLKSLAFDPHDSNVVYAAGDHEILKSTDNGMTWSDIDRDDDNLIGGPIAVEPVAPYRVFVGSLVSSDTGHTWTSANLPMGANQMAFVPGSDTLYIAGNGMQVSLDGGTTWTMASGELSTAIINSLAVAQVDSRTILYVGTPGSDLPETSLHSEKLNVQNTSPLEAGVYRLTEVHHFIYLPIVRH
jgi:photosystem II stability/assembly factor-like uncharacterized protein